MARTGSGGQSGGPGSPEDRGGSQPKYSPEDDRSIVKNGNNPAFGADAANRQKQKQGGSQPHT